MNNAEVLCCPFCSNALSAPAGHSLLGFPKWKCPSCSKSIVRPLRPGRRIAYWILLTLFMGMYLVGMLVAEAVGIPSILALLLIIALTKDSRLNRRLEAANTTSAERK